MGCLAAISTAEVQLHTAVWMRRDFIVVWLGVRCCEYFYFLCGID